MAVTAPPKVPKNKVKRYAVGNQVEQQGPPSNPSKGQQWDNPYTGKRMEYNGSGWVNIGDTALYTESHSVDPSTVVNAAQRAAGWVNQNVVQPVTRSVASNPYVPPLVRGGAALVASGTSPSGSTQPAGAPPPPVEMTNGPRGDTSTAAPYQDSTYVDTATVPAKPAAITGGAGGGAGAQARPTAAPSAGSASTSPALAAQPPVQIRTQQDPSGYQGPTWMLPPDNRFSQDAMPARYNPTSDQWEILDRSTGSWMPTTKDEIDNWGAQGQAYGVAFIDTEPNYWDNIRAGGIQGVGEQIGQEEQAAGGAPRYQGLQQQPIRSQDARFGAMQRANQMRNPARDPNGNPMLPARTVQATGPRPEDSAPFMQETTLQPNLAPGMMLGPDDFPVNSTIPQVGPPPSVPAQGAPSLAGTPQAPVREFPWVSQDWENYFNQNPVAGAQMRGIGHQDYNQPPRMAMGGPAVPQIPPDPTSQDSGRPSQDAIVGEGMESSHPEFDAVGNNPHRMELIIAPEAFEKGYVRHAEGPQMGPIPDGSWVVPVPTHLEQGLRKVTLPFSGAPVKKGQGDSYSDASGNKFATGGPVGNVMGGMATRNIDPPPDWSGDTGLSMDQRKQALNMYGTQALPGLYKGTQNIWELNGGAQNPFYIARMQAGMKHIGTAPGMSDTGGVWG